MDVDGVKLRGLIDELEGLQGQIDVLQKSRGDIYRSAKKGGLDPNTMRLVMRRRKLGEDATEYADAMLRAYEEALSLARARGTSREQAIANRPFKISEFIETPKPERLMAGR